MKTLSSLLILLLLVFIGSTNVSSSTNPPNKPACLQLIDSAGALNPNLVTIDTCQNSSTYNLKFGYHGSIWFKVKATNIPYHHDTTHLDTNWTVIDTAYPMARALFQSIETQFGPYTLIKVNPTDTIDYFGSQYFIFVFDSYVPILRVDSILSSLPNFMEGKIASSFPRPISINDEYDDPQNIPTVSYNGEKSEIDFSTSIQKNGNVLVYDILGNIVAQTQFEGGKAQIGVSSISPGTYFVKYGSYTKKILIGAKP